VSSLEVTPFFLNLSSGGDDEQPPWRVRFLRVRRPSDGFSSTSLGRPPADRFLTISDRYFECDRPEALGKSRRFTHLIIRKRFPDEVIKIKATLKS